MTKRTKHVGYETGTSSSRWLSPSKPQTGDGKTRRVIFDGLKLVFTKDPRKQGRK